MMLMGLKLRIILFLLISRVMRIQRPFFSHVLGSFRVNCYRICISDNSPLLSRILAYLGKMKRNTNCYTINHIVFMSLPPFLSALNDLMNLLFACVKFPLLLLFFFFLIIRGFYIWV